MNPPITFTIRKTPGVQEWVARFHKDGVFMPGWTVHETDRQAAEDSANATIAAYHRQLPKRASTIVQVDEWVPTALVAELRARAELMLFSLDEQETKADQTLVRIWEVAGELEQPVFALVVARLVWAAKLARHLRTGTGS